ncbi:hypothetical protein OG937_01425 [Streptomyces sp. NBC_00510]
MTSADNSDGVGPWVTVRLPDDQDLRAMMLERRQENDGPWWYQVVITLLEKNDVHGRVRSGPRRRRAGKLTPERRQELDALGMRW